jgi:CheY-like chemotaxis protein
VRGVAPRRILVVDDNADTAETLAVLLETAGHAAEFVSDPRAVLSTATRQRPDAVFLDIGMPYLDGFELAAILKRAFPGICIVGITGRESEEDRKRGRQAGFDAYVLKPVDFALVESILATMFPPGEAR